MELYRNHEYLMIKIDTDKEEKIIEQLFGERPNIAGDPPLAGETDFVACAENDDTEIVLDSE